MIIYTQALLTHPSTTRVFVMKATKVTTIISLHSFLCKIFKCLNRLRVIIGVNELTEYPYPSFHGGVSLTKFTRCVVSKDKLSYLISRLSVTASTNQLYRSLIEVTVANMPPWFSGTQQDHQIKYESWVLIVEVLGKLFSTPAGMKLSTMTLENHIVKCLLVDQLNTDTGAEGKMLFVYTRPCPLAFVRSSHTPTFLFFIQCQCMNSVEWI